MNSYVKSLFIIFILTLTSISFAQFAGGDGSPGDPYQVETPDHLYQVRFEPFASYIQIADIDFSTSMWSEMNMTSWEPIGEDIDKFIGSYNGNSYTISNLYINKPLFDNIGLFGYLEGATLRNIILTDVSITSGSNTGALAGSVTMSSNLQNCSSSGIIQGSDNIGGLVGNNSISSIVSSYSVCSVQGGWSIGGLVGYNDDSPITDSYAQGSVSGEDMTGGLIGGLNMSDITNCYSVGTINANMGIPGGLIGFDNLSMIIDSYWDIETSGCPTSFGGEGRLTVEMKMEPTFMNWNFITPIWNIDSLNSGYPYLAWSTPEEPTMIFAGGNGSEFDPYQVETAEQLDNVRDYMNSYFIQIADIDLGVAPWNEDEGWVPIGYDIEPFTGFYNGDYHKISNLFIDRIDDFNVNTGLFGYLNGQMTNSTIENVILDSVNINDERYVGALAGYVSYGNISNCSSSGTIIGEERVGGLIGFAENFSNISGSYSTCSVSSIFNMLMGEIAGGLVGEARNNSFFSNCFASGTVTGENGVGGLIGYAQQIDIVRCYSNGIVTANVDWGGGLLGYGEIITDQYSYYDKDASGYETSYAGEGKTYSEMHEQSIYETWDFATAWQMDPLLNYGYPYLAWSTPPVNNTPFAGGDGSEADPYLVATPTQLDSVRNYLDASFKQVCDINLQEYLSPGNPGYNDGEYWTPLGNEMFMEYFTGTYDGNKKTISNIKINSTEHYVGLFSSLEVDSKINDLYLHNPDSISISGEIHVGAFVGINRGTIENCYSNCNIKGLSSLGGLVAENWGDITASCCSGDISTVLHEVTFYSAGGLCAYNAGNITDCFSRGKVTAYESVGGLVADNAGSIISSYSTGEVVGVTNTGGLIASGSGCMESYWDTETSGQSTSAAGIGKTSAEMKDIATFDHFWDFTTPIWEINQYKNDGYPYLSWQNNITYDAPKLTTSIQGSFFVIEWDAIPDATYYEVYVSDKPYGNFTMIQQDPINSYGCPYDERMRFFYIVAVFSE